MRKIVAIESRETKLQPPTQDYLDWLNRAAESNPESNHDSCFPRTMETSPLDVVVATATSVAWATNMAKSLEKTLKEFMDESKGPGDKLKLLTVGLGLLYALSSGLTSVRDTVKKLGPDKK